MSDTPDFPPYSSTPRGNPIYPGNPPAPAPLQRGSALRVLFLFSFLLNLLLIGGMIVVCVMVVWGVFSVMGKLNAEPHSTLPEHHHAGQAGASSKVAIIQVDGVLLEGLLDYYEKQIEQASADSQVKAVVLRISSPGGSITASDALHRRLINLSKGDPEKGYAPKPIVVSMGAMAASGGYYIAMPGQVIYAERTTLTGSIGVYIAFPNVKELGDKYGFKMEVVKHGAVKTSGSMFQEMKPEEREVWQDMVNVAFDQFRDVVEEGRPQLKGKLEDKVINEKRTVNDKDGHPIQIQFVRQRADGGVFTAEKAKEFGLIDKIGYLDDAVKEAASLASLGSGYESITYERPKTLSDLLLGVKSDRPASALDAKQLSAGLTPRLWYLAPQSELSGILSTAGAAK
jgi:protease IV